MAPSIGKAVRAEQGASAGMIMTYLDRRFEPGAPMHVDAPAQNPTWAARLHAAALVWDNHVCLPMGLGRNLEALPLLERFAANGADVVSINAGFGLVPWDHHLLLLAQMRRWLRARPDHFALAATAEDILAAKRSGRVAVLFDVEGSAAVEPDLALVELLYDLGVRWMCVAYNRANRAGGGCHDADDPGLSAHGRALIDEMERVGMVVCCSHTGFRTARDVLDYASRPVIFSHSNAWLLHPHPRNIGDELIRGCAASGGVVGINGVNVFLGDGEASAEAMVEHIDHIVQLVGADHASLALDWLPPEMLADELARAKPLFPPGFGYDRLAILGPEALPRITELLLARGYGEADVRKVLGLNLLRIAQTVWKQPRGAA